MIPFKIFNDGFNMADTNYPEGHDLVYGIEHTYINLKQLKGIVGGMKKEFKVNDGRDETFRKTGYNQALTDLLEKLTEEIEG